jgi:hypothetical protein
MRKEIRIEVRFEMLEDDKIPLEFYKFIKDFRLVDFEAGTDGVVDQIEYTRLVFELPDA